MRDEQFQLKMQLLPRRGRSGFSGIRGKIYTSILVVVTVVLIEILNSKPIPGSQKLVCSNLGRSVSSCEWQWDYAPFVYMTWLRWTKPELFEPKIAPPDF